MMKSSIEDGILTITITGERDGVCSAPRIISAPVDALDVRKRADDLHDEVFSVLEEVSKQPISDADLMRRVKQLLGAFTAPEVNAEAVEAYITRKISEVQKRADKDAEKLAKLRKCPALEGCWNGVESPATEEKEEGQ